MTHDKAQQIKDLLQIVEDLEASDVYKAVAVTNEIGSASQKVAWQALLASDVYKAYMNAMKEAGDEVKYAAKKAYEKSIPKGD